MLIRIRVKIIVIIQPIGVCVKGNETFWPKNPDTMLGTVNTIDETVSNFIVQFKLEFAKLTNASETLLVTSARYQ